MVAELRHWIGSSEVAGTSGNFGEVYDPATGEVTGRVPFADVSEVDAAVRVAADASEDWRSASVARRTAVLFGFRQLLREHREELATVVTAEHGKVVADALAEVDRGTEVVEFACGIGQLLKGGASVGISTGVDSRSLRQPLGVVAGITPFNFPVMVPLWMSPVAIACGNAFVLKPSEKVPSAANLLASLWHEAGLPSGAFGVVHGDRVAVDRLLEHPDVRAVSFVGSTPVARHVYETATRAGKRAQALGGAKNHMVVLPDADLGLAADAAVNAGFGAAGERCMAISVVVAVEPIGDELVHEIATRTAAIRVGDGRGAADMGPLVTRTHLERVSGYVRAGVDSGAELVVDGRDHEVEGTAGGFWLGPTLFDHVKPDMSIYADEIFGPVLCVVRVGSYAEALRLVNDNPYGNGTAIFTNDGGAAREFEVNVEAGMVGINVPIPVPTAYYSFGGWKGSLFGDVHVHGPEGIQFYTRGKYVVSRWQDPAHGGLDLGFPQHD